MIDSGLMNIYKLVLELTLLIMPDYHYYNSCDVHKHTLCDKEYVTNCLVLPSIWGNSTMRRISNNADQIIDSRLIFEGFVMRCIVVV